MRCVLISSYELGRQPFGLASPAAWLEREGAEVICIDLAVQSLDHDAILGADMVAFYVPMHTATRLVSALIPQVKKLNPEAHVVCYGLYAPMNEVYLRSLGADTILGGEFEAGLASLVGANGWQPSSGMQPTISLARQQFLVPQRASLPDLSHYAHLHLGNGESRTVGYTEASRGCKHTCRHCPVVPVYEGKFRVVQRSVVLEDIRRQVLLGAQHITFGDPDFFNGIGHALPIARALHDEFPEITYDVTIKIEHLLQHAEHLPTLRDTGCLFVTSAIESIDDHVLKQLDKGHTQADILRVAEMFREIDLHLVPTLVAFTPWTTLESYRQLINFITQSKLVDNVPSIQLAIRLLIPAGSKLLELTEIRNLVGVFDEQQLVHPWSHHDAALDDLQKSIFDLIESASGESRREIFSRVASLVDLPIEDDHPYEKPTLVPHLTEPWYC